MKEKIESRIISIGTAVPEYIYLQDDLALWMYERLNKEDPRMARIFRALYKKTKIRKRHSVLGDFKSQSSKNKLFKAEVAAEPKVETRLVIYNREAPKLAQAAVDDCLKNSDRSTITHIITVSCTGMSAPGLEIQLKQQLGLSNTTQSYAVNFVGCYAFFPALKMANAFIKSDPTAKVLIVAVELCTLHFQNKETDDHLLSNSLFADGAAAALLSAKPEGEKNLIVKATNQVLIPKGEKDMAWDIHSNGFLMKLSSYIPQLVDEGIKNLIEKILIQQNISIEQINHWAIHPGGRKILEVCEQELQLNNNELQASYQTLKDFGNMSAPTILFVLKEMLETAPLQNGDHLLSCGFGPGLTLEAALFEFEAHA